jgi:hypothetical protein
MVMRQRLLSRSLGSGDLVFSLCVSIMVSMMGLPTSLVHSCRARNWKKFPRFGLERWRVNCFDKSRVKYLKRAMERQNLIILFIIARQFSEECKETIY